MIKRLCELNEVRTNRILLYIWFCYRMKNRECLVAWNQSKMASLTFERSWRVYASSIISSNFNRISTARNTPFINFSISQKASLVQDIFQKCFLQDLENVSNKYSGHPNYFGSFSGSAYFEVCLWHPPSPRGMINDYEMKRGAFWNTLLPLRAFMQISVESILEP